MKNTEITVNQFLFTTDVKIKLIHLVSILRLVRWDVSPADTRTLSCSPTLFDLGVLTDFLTEELLISTFRNCQLVDESSSHIVINSLSAPIYCMHDSDCQTKNISATAEWIHQAMLMTWQCRSLGFTSSIFN